MTVAFVTEHGDLPDLSARTRRNFLIPTSATRSAAAQWYSSWTAPAAASDASLVSVTGTTESLECSGRGLCDRSTGQCECFPGYASSDGVGGPGKQDDCGYRSTLYRRVVWSHWVNFVSKNTSGFKTLASN